MSRQSLPVPRGPVSDALCARLRSGGRSGAVVLPRTGVDVLDDDDLQLALHVVYELSYRGFDAIDDAMEWDEGVLRVRRGIETDMEAQLRDLVGPLPEDAASLLVELSTRGGGRSFSAYMVDAPDLARVREFAVHRAAYQLKEADPHTWGLPRLHGRAKSAMVEIQSDEYGRGIPGAAHAELFARTLRALDLDPTYGRYVDLLPASTLATGNLIGLLGLQRRLLPALIGHLALFEMTSTGPMARYAATLESLGVEPAGREFFEVHVVADAYHEVLALKDLVGGFLEDEPGAGQEVSFGALALMEVERRFSTHLLDSFDAGRSSLLAPLRSLAPSLTSAA